MKYKPNSNLYLLPDLKSPVLIHSSLCVLCASAVKNRYSSGGKELIENAKLVARIPDKPLVVRGEHSQLLTPTIPNPAQQQS